MFYHGGKFALCEQYLMFVIEVLWILPKQYNFVWFHKTNLKMLGTMLDKSGDKFDSMR